MIRVAARGSKLSRAQANLVIDYLKGIGYEVEFLEVKTRGDVFSTQKVAELGKGVFEKEVNQKVLEGEADLAVHSMKDMESDLDNRLEIVATLPRESPLDVIVSPRNVSVYEMERETLGTSSQRRRNFVNFVNPLITVKELRGNLDTRILRLQQGNFDAIIVAEAGIRRLKLDVKYKEIDPYDLTPAPNQGIIAVVARRDNDKIKTIIRNLSSEESYNEALAEREASKALGAGCNSSLGILFNQDGNRLEGIGTIYTPKIKLSVAMSTSKEPKDAGELLARRLREEAKKTGISIQA
ncbi:hydroxymethylbilane synthase [Sulfuracidifex tepidarius]|uniref:Hydroxymethylbilane synthase n=1 Tax=Sulfuracidifex tepidarius TaxID=1294262 RepID=A0A510E4A5_9CREN|nr:hydroxymethylbilane synthase [Sulfuracidifex tepidarius]BBG24546.1 Porphobilinogen deaminase [Sulfuracidifex tepidarius]BBG27334.1 Porphobilinogen deaminase [Sulfuracidifex tepidarius]